MKNKEEVLEMIQDFHFQSFLEIKRYNETPVNFISLEERIRVIYAQIKTCFDILEINEEEREKLNLDLRLKGYQKIPEHIKSKIPYREMIRIF